MRAQILSKERSIMAKAYSIQTQEVLRQLDKMLAEENTCPVCKAKQNYLMQLRRPSEKA